MDDKISKALNLSPIQIQKDIVATIAEGDDTAEAVANIKELLNTGQTALEDLLDLARASQQPRAYEVIATLIKTMVDANREVVEISAKKLGTQVNNDNRQVHNHMYVGSTAELLKALKQARAEDSNDG